MKILGTGSYLPPKVVTNDDLARSLDTSDEWIHSHTGIHSRHIAEADDCTSTMAEKALEASGVSPEEIGLIIVATSTPDYNTFPATACLVQNALGCKNAGACDLQAACAGFIYALDQGRCGVAAHPDRKVRVIGAETLSRIVDWTDRATCILFGDGAGAVVVGADGDTKPHATVKLGADGSGCEFISRAGGARVIPAPGQVPVPFLVLQGRPVFNFAVKTMDAVVRGLCDSLGLVPSELDRIFAHQANGRILEAVGRRMGLPMDKFFMNIETTGNTSAASIPVALDEAIRRGELKDGDRICLVGFGAGLTYGGILTEWPRV